MNKSKDSCTFENGYRYSINNKIEQKKDKGKIQYRARYSFAKEGEVLKPYRAGWQKSVQEAIHDAEKKIKERIYGCEDEEKTLRDLDIKKVSYEYVNNEILKDDFLKTNGLGTQDTYAKDIYKLFGKYELVDNKLVLGKVKNQRNELIDSKPLLSKKILNTKVKRFDLVALKEFASEVNKLRNSSTNDLLCKSTNKKYRRLMANVIKYANDNYNVFTTNEEIKNYQTLIDEILYIEFPKEGKLPEASDRTERVINPIEFRELMINNKHNKDVLSYSGLEDDRFAPNGYMDTAHFYNPLTNSIPREAMSYIMYSLLFYTGMRAGELKALTYDDIKFIYKKDFYEQKDKFFDSYSKLYLWDENGELIDDEETKIMAIVYINKAFSAKDINKRHKVSRPKTKKSIRAVALEGNIVEELNEYKKAILHVCGEDEDKARKHLIVYSKDGDYISDNGMNGRLATMLKEFNEKHHTNKKFTKHDMRRSRMNEDILYGADINVIVRYYGLGSKKTLERQYYALKAKQEAMNVSKNRPKETITGIKENPNIKRLYKQTKKS